MIVISNIVSGISQFIESQFHPLRITKNSYYVSHSVMLCDKLGVKRRAEVKGSSEGKDAISVILHKIIVAALEQSIQMNAGVTPRLD